MPIAPDHQHRPVAMNLLLLQAQEGQLKRMREAPVDRGSPAMFPTYAKQMKSDPGAPASFEIVSDEDEIDSGGDNRVLKGGLRDDSRGPKGDPGDDSRVLDSGTRALTQ